MLSRHRCKDAKSKTRAQLWPCHTVNSCPLTNCSLCSKNVADLLHFQLLKRKKDAISFFFANFSNCRNSGRKQKLSAFQGPIVQFQGPIVQ